MQRIGRLFPAPFVGPIVPLRDQIAQGASAVTEGDAAVHTAGRLKLQLFRREGLIELLAVLQTFGDGALLGRLPLVVHEAGDLTH
ncbi:hypothetical protein MAIT1_03871 [Magnetofaba australis IT-1]|uniref:Uncharacterized protein n=1 Tax=Magnetofaba australis IT-1 TaxID=1434232 RepID=A0A1Y2K8X7_9PROT|nr:hypothetical protein MAIT1_03871 [Magnetofaba australis IT-1]